MAAEVVRRDGSRVWLRPIVPEDKPVLVEGFERLSAGSRYARFLGGVKGLTPEILSYLTEIDYVDHFAWLARALEVPRLRGVGVARYIRLRDEPEVAEVAVTVADDWQGCGLGTVLVEAPSAVAVENGIERFRALVAAENRPARAILRRVGVGIVVDSPGLLRAEIDLAAWTASRAAR